MTRELEQELDKRNYWFVSQFRPLAYAIDEATVSAIKESPPPMGKLPIGELVERTRFYQAITAHMKVVDHAPTDVQMSREGFKDKYKFEVDEAVEILRGAHGFFQRPLDELVDTYLRSQASHLLKKHKPPSVDVKMDVVELMREALEDSFRNEDNVVFYPFPSVFTGYVYEFFLPDLDVRSAKLASDAADLYLDIRSDTEHLNADVARQRAYDFIGDYILEEGR